MDLIDLSIIIVSYNTRKLTLECLRSIYRETTGIDHEIIVVDNDSKDGSAAAVEGVYPGVTLLALKDNVGFAQGVNIGARHAKGRSLLLLNPDVVVLDGAIQKLWSFAEEKLWAGIYGGRTLYSDGSLNPSSCWRRPTVWSVFCYGAGLTTFFRRTKIFDGESYGSWERDTVRPVDIVSGCFLLIKRSLWKKLGGFDPSFYMYGEEADLCIRAKKLGYQPIINPSATIIHYGSSSERKYAEKMIRQFRSKILLMQRHWDSRLASVGALMYGLGAFGRATIYKALQVVGSESIDKKGRDWREIWNRRAEWLTLS